MGNGFLLGGALTKVKNQWKTTSCCQYEAVPVSHHAPLKDVEKNFDFAVDFIRRQDGGRPSFPYVPIFVTHGPQEAPLEEVVAMSVKTGADRKLAEMLASISRTDARLRPVARCLTEAK